MFCWKEWDAPLDCDLNNQLGSEAANDIWTSPGSTGMKKMLEDSRGSATMIAAQRETAGACAGSDNPAARGVADRLSLTAAPTFAIMALLVLRGGPLLRSATRDASPLSGMVPMYLRKSAFDPVIDTQRESQASPFGS